MFLSLCGEPPIRSLNRHFNFSASSHYALSSSSFRFAINSEPLHRPTSILCSLVTERDPGISECFCVGVLTLRYGTSSYFCQGTSSTCSGATPASLLVKPPALYSRQLPNCTRIASSSFPLPTACTSFSPCRASSCPVPLPEPLSTQPLANIPSSPPINEQTSDLDTPPSKPIPNPTSLEMTGFST